jgi:hypothetical protein
MQEVGYFFRSILTIDGCIDVFEFYFGFFEFFFVSVCILKEKVEKDNG